MKGETLKLGSLGRTSKGSSKKKLQRLVVNSAFFLSLLIAHCSPRLYWCSWLLLSSALLVLAKLELISFSLSCLQTYGNGNGGLGNGRSCNMQWHSSLLMVCPSCFHSFLVMFMVVLSLGSIGVHGCCFLGLC
jgi:hypothetical protein